MASGTQAQLAGELLEDRQTRLVFGAVRGRLRANDVQQPGGWSDDAVQIEAGGVRVFHAGTARADGAIVAAGGRGLNVTATGKCVTEAQARAYAAVDKLDFASGFYRRDIGWREVAREAR